MLQQFRTSFVKSLKRIFIIEYGYKNKSIYEYVYCKLKIHDSTLFVRQNIFYIISIITEIKKPSKQQIGLLHFHFSLCKVIHAVNIWLLSIFYSTQHSNLVKIIKLAWLNIQPRKFCMVITRYTFGNCLILFFSGKNAYLYRSYKNQLQSIGVSMYFRNPNTMYRSKLVYSYL